LNSPSYTIIESKNVVFLYILMFKINKKKS